MAMGPFQTNHNVVAGEVVWLADDVRTVAAPNAGPMTFTGTQTYILGQGTVALIDPGPADARHLRAIRDGVKGDVIEAVLVTHSHADHSPLAAAFDAPVYGFGSHDAARAEIMGGLGDVGGGEGIDPAFSPDLLVADGETISGNGWQVEAIHTPGHLSNHLCFASGGRVFSGDHVMGWASTLISPPDGDLGAYMRSLEKMRARPDRIYYPGHGGPVEAPHDLIDWLLDHRRTREGQIVGQLEGGAMTVAQITAAIYHDVDPRLHGAAGRNVLAHLIDLFERKIVTADRFDAGGRYELV